LIQPKLDTVFSAPELDGIRILVRQAMEISAKAVCLVNGYILCWDSVGLPEGKEKLIQLWLLNDENHSFDQVVESVSRASHADENQALSVALQVDLFSRACVLTSRDSKRIEEASKFFTDIGLDIHVLPDDGRRHLYVLESQVIALLDWLTELSCASAEFALYILECLETRISSSDVLTGVLSKFFAKDSLSLLELLVVSSFSFTEKTSKSFHSFFIQLCTLSEFKFALGACLMQNYRSLLVHHTHVGRLCSDSALSLAVQLFTFPDLSRALYNHPGDFGLETDLLSIMFESMKSDIDICINKDSRKLISHLPESLIQAASHIEYCLCCEGFCSPELVERSLLHWFAVLLKAEFLNPHFRLVAAHVEFDSDAWKDALFLCLWMERVTRFFMKAFEKYLKEADVPSSTSFIDSIRLLLCDLQTVVNSNPVSAGPFESTAGSLEVVPAAHVSFHLPFSRVIIRLCHSILRRKIPGSFTIVEDILGMTPWHRCNVIDRHLKIVFASYHIERNFWVRNGFSVLNEVANYKAPHFVGHMLSIDILALQVRFLIAIYSLSAWGSCSGLREVC
jgi:hypothetical protein